MGSQSGLFKKSVSGLDMRQKTSARNMQWQDRLEANRKRKPVGKPPIPAATAPRFYSTGGKRVPLGQTGKGASPLVAPD